MPAPVVFVKYKHERNIPEPSAELTVQVSELHTVTFDSDKTHFSPLMSLNFKGHLGVM